MWMRELLLLYQLSYSFTHIKMRTSLRRQLMHMRLRQHRKLATS